MKLLSVSCFATLCLFTFAGAQDEPEPKEKTLPEAKAEFAKADKALNAAYAQAKKALPDYEFKDLRKDQREWIEYRDARTLEGMQFDYGIDLPDGIHDDGVDGAKSRERARLIAQKSPHYWTWLAGLSETRTEILRGWRGGIGDPDSFTGRYIDGYGGHMQILQKDGQLFFQIEVVRGPTYHLGSIDGTAQINHDMARFTDAGSDEKDEQDDETWLTFIHESSRWVKIIGTNTQHYHGARAYFDGRFIRVAELKPEASAELEKLGEAGEESDDGDE